MEAFKKNMKDYIEHFKRYKISSVIGIVSCTICAISMIFILFGFHPIFLLIWMISGGVGGAAVQYQITKEKERPMTEEERRELKEMLDICIKELEEKENTEGQIKPGI